MVDREDGAVSKFNPSRRGLKSESYVNRGLPRVEATSVITEMAAIRLSEAVWRVRKTGNWGHNDVLSS